LKSISLETNFFLSKNALCSYTGKIEVLCFHGLCCSKENFIPLLDLFKKSKINASSIDLPGFGLNTDISFKKNLNTYDGFFRMLKANGSLSSNLIIILHSVSSCFIEEINKYLNYKLIILLEGNLIKEDTKWTELISNMTEKKFEIYVKYLRSNYFKVLSNTMVNKMDHLDVKLYFSNGINFDRFMLMFLAKLGLKRTRNGSISSLIKKNKQKFFFVSGSRVEMQQTIDFLNINFIKYIKLENCGHYPMIEKTNNLFNLIKRLMKNEYCN
jgi:hypothetical protein